MQLRRRVLAAGRGRHYQLRPDDRRLLGPEWVQEGRSNVRPAIAAICQVGPIAVGAAVLVLLGVDDLAAFGGVLLIQAVFSAASLFTALTRRFVRRSWNLPAWIDVPLLIGAPAIAAIPLVGFALTAGGAVALVFLVIAGLSHGYAGVVLDRWARDR